MSAAQSYRRMMDELDLNPKEFEHVNYLGSGSYGRVVKAKWTQIVEDEHGRKQKKVRRSVRRIC